MKPTSILLLLLLLLAGLPTVARAEAASPLLVQIPLGQLVDAQSMHLSDQSGALEIDLPTSPSWQLNADVALLLRATYSDALDLQRSALVFSVNDTPVASLPLIDVSAGTAPVTLPAVRFGPRSNRLSILARLYLKTDPPQAGCRDLSDTSRWVNVSPESELQFSLAPRDQPYTLEEFPAPFQGVDFSQAGFHQVPTTFVLPDQPASADLRSLVAAAFAFGRALPEQNAWSLQVLTRSQLQENAAAGSNLVFLGGTQQGLLNLDAPHQDAVALAPSPFNPRRAALVILDANPEDGSRPELALTGGQAGALSGSFVHLAASAPHAPSAAPLLGELSLQALGYHDRSVRGVGVQSLIYRLYLPYDTQLKSANLDLVLYHTKNLAQGRSLANIYVNGVEVAGILLNDRDSDGQPTEINLPVKHFRPGANYLRFTFDLRVPVGVCAPDENSVSVTLADSSFLELEGARTARTPTLADFPQPFNGLEGATLVLPDNPDPETLNRVVRLAVLIGQTAQFDASPPSIVTASTFDPQVDGKQHLIFIGAPQKNPLVFQINSSLPQPFDAGGMQLAAGYGIAPNSAAPTGLVEIARSPWDRSRRILAITGVDQPSFLQAFELSAGQRRAIPPSDGQCYGSARQADRRGRDPEPLRPGSGESAAARAAFSIHPSSRRRPVAGSGCARCVRLVLVCSQCPMDPRPASNPEKR